MPSAAAGSAQNHSAQLYDAPEQFRDVRLDAANFASSGGRRDEVQYHFRSHEESRSCESSFTNELSMLYGMTRMSLPQSSTGGTRITRDAGGAERIYGFPSAALSST